MSELHSLAYTSSSSLHNSSLGWDIHHSSLGVLNTDTMSLGTHRNPPSLFFCFLSLSLFLSPSCFFIPQSHYYYCCCCFSCFQKHLQLWMAMLHFSHLSTLISLLVIWKMLWLNSATGQKEGV